MKLQRAALTHVGQVRDHNEDTFGIGEGAPVERLGELLVVCDGMGGHAAGEVASRIGVDTILDLFYRDNSPDRAAALSHAFERANQQIYTKGRGTMGTTGVAALLYRNALLVANVGDSRAYLLHNGGLRQLSRDHSVVSDQVAAGMLTEAEARHSSIKNIITRALGNQGNVAVDMFHVPIEVGDVVLLSSDGLHGLIEDDEIADIIGDHPLDEAATTLIDLANARGGNDNITAVMARVEALDDDSHPSGLGTPTAKLPETAASTKKPADSAPLTPLTLRATQPTPREPRLTLRGGLLAAIMALALIAVIVYFANQQASVPALTPPATAPALATAAVPTAAAQPTTATTALPTFSAPTSAPATITVATAAPTP